MSIKYYHLAKDEEPPEEFCAVRDIGGEPSEYTFYVPEAENAKLREQTELLVTLLRNDCDIEASWDGLRHFWSIELTDDGCLMRDRACKAEAENAKLRELVRDVYSLHWHGADCTECPWFDECDNHGGGCPWLGILANRMSELGIEATE